MSNYSKKVICPDCGIEYSYSNVSAHRKTKKHRAGRPVQVISLGEHKEVRPDPIENKMVSGREFKIPLAPVFNIVQQDRKAVPMLRVEYRDRKDIFGFQYERKLSPVTIIRATDDLKTVNQKLNILFGSGGIPANGIEAIEQGVLFRHKHLVLKFTIKNNEIQNFFNSQPDTVRYITLKKDGYYKLFLTGKIPGELDFEYRRRINHIMSGLVLDEKRPSDDWDNFDLSQVVNLELILGDNAIRSGKNFGYFDYHNLTDINLSRYQVYTSTDRVPYEMCLIHTLKMCGISDELIKKCIVYISKVEKSETGVIFKPVAFIQTNKFLEISNIIQKKINIEYFNQAGNSSLHKSFGEHTTAIEIGLFKNHIFINDKLPFTRYSLTNYLLVKDRPDYNRIYDNCRHYKNVDLTVCTILSLLFNANLFQQITEINVDNMQSVYHVTNENLLDNIDTEQRPFSYIEKEDTPRTVWYADLENINSNVQNIPFLSGLIREDQKSPTLFVGLDCITKLLDYIIKNSHKKTQTVVYFHNLKYDFALMKNFVKVITICEKAGSLYSVNISYKKCMITLKDSYKLFSESLFKFGNAFKLDVCKEEGIAYNYYTLQNFMNEEHSIRDYTNMVKPKEQKTFLKNIEGKFNNNGTTFDALGYYLHYLNLDVIVLQQAMIAFDILMIKTFGRSIHRHLTISSYADNYFIRQGCYDGLYECKGNLRLYLSKAIYGGRVNVLEKVKKTCVNERINDFDGVSLYPSAIKRICEESGFPKGQCQRWNTLIDLKTVDTFVVTVCITKINKKQNNPFIAYRHDNKIDYINELSGPLVVVIDKTTLEDYILFHEIEYQILDGVYWNSGFNRKFISIETLFNERVKQKKLNTKAGNILQNIYKLMMNSAYGKTILSSTDTHRVIKDEKYFMAYMFNNYDTIDYAQKLNDKQYLITQHRTDEGFNRAIVGINILSMSKRIMNEVMGLASDTSIDIFYQDTDSMHMLDRDIPVLNQVFKKKYNRVLIGSGMGQFHSDFGLGECKNVIAVRSYFLGKKCYMDILEGDNKGVLETGFHIRMKGISENGFADAAKGDPENIFKKLCQGDTINFNLSCSNSVRFKFTSTGVKKLDENSFSRNVKF